MVEKFPNSVEYRYWYLVNLGSWAEEYGVFAAAREGVADQMRYHSKKIIEIDPYYENGAGYFLLGAVLWSGVTIFAQKANNELHPINFSFWVYGVAMLIALPIFPHLAMGVNILYWMMRVN